MTRLIGFSPQLSELSGLYIPNTVLKRLGWIGGDKITTISSGDDLSEDTSKFSDDSIDLLCRSCPNLRHLRIDENKNWSFAGRNDSYLTNASIKSIVTHCKKLESLSIKWYNITNEAMDILATLSSLKEFHIDVVDHITSGGIRMVLKANCGLTSLSISAWSAIDNSLLNYISQSLPYLRELTLDVREGCQDISEDSSSFLTIPQGCPLLEKIKIDGWCFGDDLLVPLTKHCTRLRHLQFDWVREDDEQTTVTEAALIRLFQACPDLRTLSSLPYVATDSCLYALATHCARLEAVGITTNNHVWLTLVTNAGLCALFKACSSLTDVRIENCDYVTDESVFTLVRYCPEVRIMALSSPTGKLTEASLLSISTHSRKLQKLTVCHMSVSDDLLSIIARRCKYLTDIEIKQCTSITSTGIVNLINKCHRLKRVRVWHCKIQISPELKKYTDIQKGHTTEVYLDVFN